MRIELTTNEFTEVTITSGTLQNISPQASVEVASTATKNTGIILPPYATLSYSDNATVYARNAWDDDSTCVIAVEPFKKGGEGGGGSYTLPIATASKLGGVKIGSNVSINESGVISVAAPYSLPTAAANTLGGIKVGSGLSISDGVLSVTGGGSNDPVGRVVFDVVLRDGYIKANGATVSDASTSIPNLLAFVQDNPSLLAEDSAAYAANVGLYLYDSGTDELTLPNYTGRVMQGGANVESIEAGLPNIKGEIKMHYGNLNSASATGAIYTETPDHHPFAGTQDSSSNMCNDMFKFDASKSNAIYSDSISTVQSPAINMIPQIKY